MASKMAESVEYKTMIACFDNLVTALKSDPQSISNQLVAKTLIPPTDDQPDARTMALRLLEKIQLSPDRFNVVLKVFTRNVWMKEIVTILRFKYGMCVT